uniref:Golgi apparatus membrane protein TVP23 homolog n=1 Tax=Oxyrrhis marina TaxID=2969 RepID=A0A7S3UJ71_OXYMA
MSTFVVGAWENSNLSPMALKMHEQSLSQNGWPVIWSSFLILNVLSFDINYIILMCIAVVFSGSNVYGYFKCSKDQGQRMSELQGRFAQSAVQAVASRALG